MRLPGSTKEEKLPKRYQVPKEKNFCSIIIKQRRLLATYLPTYSPNTEPAAKTYFLLFGTSGIELRRSGKNQTQRRTLGDKKNGRNVCALRPFCTKVWSTRTVFPVIVSQSCLAWRSASCPINEV